MSHAIYDFVNKKSSKLDENIPFYWIFITYNFNSNHI